jgi:hypothetical protein
MLVLADFGWQGGVAIASLVISICAIKLSIDAGRREVRAEDRDVERLERERSEAEEAKRAKLDLWPYGSSTPTSTERRFGYVITNYGKVTAQDVHVWLYTEDGTDVSIGSPPPYDLDPGPKDDTHGVTVPVDVKPEDVRFGVRWRDGIGHHKRTLGIPPTM